MKLLKTGFVLCATNLFIANIGYANIECFGRTNDKKEVTLSIETDGFQGRAKFGSVNFKVNGNKIGYQLEDRDFNQFFESDEIGTDKSGALLGTKALAGGVAPVSLQYIGPNLKGLDLKVVYDREDIKKLKGNFLILWKGYGYSEKEQYSIEQVACSTEANL